MVCEPNMNITMGLWASEPLYHAPQIPYLPQVQLGPDLVQTLIRGPHMIHLVIVRSRFRHGKAEHSNHAEWCGSNSWIELC